MMPRALSAAWSESKKFHALADSLGASLAQAEAVEAATKDRLSQHGTLEERAFAAAREALAKKRRNLQKKLRQVDQITAKSVELSKEEKAKVAKKVAIERELRALDRPSSVPSAVTGWQLSSEERKDAEAAGFFRVIP
jgi:small-conductance mechanosensitive channel